MPHQDRDLVIQALRNPPCMRSWTPLQFDLLLRQARSSNLLGRLGALVEQHGLAAALPEGLQNHLRGAQRLLNTHREQVRREVGHIGKALAPLDVPLVLLKGAAYVMAGLPAEQGRMFSDVDILVPRARLPEVESSLMLAGWIGTHQSAYDQRYYREWMHELPPMVHMTRETTLDVHHGISPLTARWPVSSDLLLAGIVPLPDTCGTPGLSVFAPVDMVLHSMVHLLLNEEFANGLRDVSDLDLLLRHFGAEATFWPRLVQRAAQLGLQRALHHGLWCAAEVLLTPVPADVQQAVSGWGPASIPAALVKASWRRALCAPHASVADAGTPVALLLLTLRAHWLRMPPLMLARHLFIKTFKLHEKRPAQATPQ